MRFARVVKISVQNVEFKKNWTLTADAFRRFLEWLDEGADSDGQKYLEMRQRLVAYFDRKNALAPDELADETLNRAARRLMEEGRIETETPAKYCYTVARFVFLESLRGRENSSIPLDDVMIRQADEKSSARIADEREMKEKMLVCLEQCTNKLEAANRDLIVRYYFGEERIKIDNRHRLAQSLGITVNALSIRACRIRDKLEACVGKCADEN